MEEKQIKISNIRFSEGQIIISSTIHHQSSAFRIVETTLYADKLSDLNKVFIDNIKSMASSIVSDMDENKEEVSVCRCKNCGCGKK